MAWCAKYRKIWFGILHGQRTRDKRFLREDTLMTTLAPLKSLWSQKPGREKNVYLLLSLALLDFSGEDLVSEDATDSKFPVRPLWTVENNCFILLCYLMKHYWCTVHAKKKTSCFFLSKDSKKDNLSTENLILKKCFLLASGRWSDLELKHLWELPPLFSTTDVYTICSILAIFKECVLSY